MRSLWCGLYVLCCACIMIIILEHNCVGYLVLLWYFSPACSICIWVCWVVWPLEAIHSVIYSLL